MVLTDLCLVKMLRCVHRLINRAMCRCLQALQDYGIVLLLGDVLTLKVLINRGLLYFERRDYRNALYDLLLAAHISPTEKFIHHTLGFCCHKSVQLLISCTPMKKIYVFNNKLVLCKISKRLL